MHQYYNATIELARRVDEDGADQLLRDLEVFGVTLTESLRRRTQVVLTVEAGSLRTASVTALGMVEAVGEEPVSIQLMTTKEFDASAGLIDVPTRLYSVTEAAKLLGVSPQAVRARIKTGSLPATRIGESWAVPAGLLGEGNPRP